MNSISINYDSMLRWMCGNHAQKMSVAEMRMLHWDVW